MGMHDTLRQTHHLDIEDFLARSFHVRTCRDERMRIHLTLQHEVTNILGRSSIYDTNAKLLVEHRILDVTLRINIGGIGASLRTKLLHIYLSHNHLRFDAKTFTFTEQLSILIDKCIATIDNILRTLTKAARTIHIARDGTGTLL